MISRCVTWTRIIRHHLGVLLTIAATLVLITATPADAHTAFESSTPADGDSLDEPVSEISLVFSAEAAPAGEGFAVLDPQGLVRIPDQVTSTDNLTWTLRFDEPLAGGVVGVRWSVAAPDTHPIAGSFSFTVTAAAQTDEAVLAAQQEAADQSTSGSSVSDAIGAETTAPARRAPADLADFLDTEDAATAGVGLVGGLGRILSLFGVIFAFGGIAFVAFALRGDRGDIRAALYWIRRAALIAMLGALVEAAVQVASLISGWSGLWSASALTTGLSSSFGFAIGLRFVGAALIASGVRLATHAAEHAVDPIMSVPQLAAVRASQVRETPATGEPLEPDSLLHDGDEAWHVSQSPRAVVGAALLVASFLFDGHTVSEGPRWLHAAANLIHVATAATWAGGVVMLALIIARRHRRNGELRALQLAVRFSVVATVALVFAAATGAILSMVILDSVSDIWSTPWGRLLIVKVVLVAVAGVGGGYNHRVVIPALERSPTNEAVAHQFRKVITVEAIVMIAIAAVTGLLIAAAST